MDVVLNVRWSGSVLPYKNGCGSKHEMVFGNVQVTWREREARNPSSPRNTAIYRHRTTALRTSDTSKCVCALCVVVFWMGGQGVVGGGE